MLKPFLRLAVFFVAVSALGAETHTLPPHPRLLLDAAGVAELKQRIAAAPWAKASWEELKSHADAALARPLALPPRGGNWGHNYVCPIHGARLRQGKKIGDWQWEHICPVGDHVLRGDPSKATLDFDGNAMMAIHLDYAREAVEDGLAYQVTGDARYAHRAREILLAYAERYHAYPLHDNWGRGSTNRVGRVASQSLTEASWLIDMTHGADLVWDALSDADRGAIAEKLLLPALNEIIIPQKYGIHNIQCRENSAIGLVGFLLGDEKLIALAIDDPQYGFREQIAKGITADGLWLEGSTGYHFFTVEGLWPLMEAARHCGRDLYGPKFKSMFDGPFALAMPNLMLPNFNDSGVSPLQERADLYELAFARFHDAAYAPLLQHGNRRGRMALLFGAAKIPAGKVPTPSASRNLTASGYAILERDEKTNATWLATKYGPHGGGHGHPDKNSFILFAHGDVLAPDAGTHAYGSPLHAGWDKTTLAHNTLVVDEASQKPAQGKCLAFGREQDVDYSISDAGPIYDGVNFVRTAAMLAPELVVFVDQVKADAEHNFDLVYHQNGAWEELPPGDAWASPAIAGYRYFTGTTVRATPDAGLTLKTRFKDRAPAIVIAPGEPGKIITGYGIMKTTEDRVPLLVQRRHGDRTVFVWAVSIDGSPVTLRAAAVKNAAGKDVDATEAVQVDVAAGKQRWSLLVNPQRNEIVATTPNGSSWKSDAIFAVRTP